MRDAWPCCANNVCAANACVRQPAPGTYRLQTATAQTTFSSDSGEICFKVVRISVIFATERRRTENGSNHIPILISQSIMITSDSNACSARGRCRNLLHRFILNLYKLVGRQVL